MSTGAHRRNSHGGRNVRGIAQNAAIIYDARHTPPWASAPPAPRGIAWLEGRRRHGEGLNAVPARLTHRGKRTSEAAVAILQGRLKNISVPA